MATDLAPDTVSPTSKGVGQAYVLFFCSLVLTWIGGSIVQLLWTYPGLAITEIVFILVPAIAYVRLKGLPIAEGLEWRKVTIGTALASALVGITAYGVAVGMTLLTYPLLGPPPEFNFFQLNNVRELLLTYCVAAVLPGICEETLFRGAIQGTLRRLGLPKSLMYTSLLFAAFHGNPWNFVGPLFLGFVLGILAERSGSIVSSMIAHGFVNATAFTVAYLYGEAADESVLVVPSIVLSVGFILVLGAYLVWTRGRQTELPLLSRVPAGVPPWAKWLAWASMSSAAVVVVALVIVVRSTVGLYAAANDVPDADVRKGDQVLVLRSGATPNNLRPGDLVAYKRGGEKHVGQVDRLKDARVWIRDKSGEIEVAITDVLGKVIQTLPGPRKEMGTTRKEKVEDG